MHARIFLLVLVLFSGLALADNRTPPASWSLESNGVAMLSSLDQDRFDALDLEAISAEDASRESMGEPPRFAWPHQTRISPAQRGTWDTAGDISIWRYRVTAENANLINFGFDNFHLPEGSQLWIYSPKAALDGQMNRHSVIGPYDSSINNAHGEFWTPNLAGDGAIIEINVPTDRQHELNFDLVQVSHGYRGFGDAALGYHQQASEREGDGKQICSEEGGARSGACNQDVACLSEDDPWNDPRRSVGAYSRSGSFACTGSLVNNTAQDQRMLFLTATHCIVESQAASIVVYWNYEWPTCRRPGAPEGTQTNAPDPNITNTGGTWLAATVNPFTGGGCTTGSQCSDMTLIELNQPANPDFELHWSGWDRRPPPTVCAQGPGNSTDGLCATIHHPGVDEKRITWVAQDMQVGNIAAATGVHWHPFWHPNPPELPNMPGGAPATIPPAVTEGGSSGSPLYSAERRLLGVLSGGPAFCGATGAQLSDFYGGLWHAWDGLGTATSRMKDYLDPLGTEPLFINGTDGDGFELIPDTTSVSQCGFDDIIINIDVNALGDFAGDVNLTLAGLDASLDGSFSVNPVTPPGSTVLTIGDLAVAGAGSYSFSVEGLSGDFDASINISLIVADGAPSSTAVTSPADGALGVSATPTIEWSEDQGVSFELEIASDAGFNDVVYSATGTGNSHEVTDPLDTNSSYFVRVRMANDCGQGDWSNAISFTTEALPGDCPIGTAATSLLSENFDGGSLPAGWSTAGSTGTTTWVTSTAQTHSGSHSVFAQNIASVSDQRLATPTVSLPSDAVSLFLNFQNWQRIESNGSAACYDGGLLEISTNGGTSWSQVGNEHILVRDYDGPISTSFSNPLGGSQGWCGDPRDAWERYSVNLANWAGLDAQFRFRFGTDSSVTRVGWYVDSVDVRACMTSDPYTVGGAVSGLEGSGLVLQNNGGDDLAIANNGSFEFSSPAFDGQSYNVTVAQQPTIPFQSCEVSNGSGIIAGEDITNIDIVCTVLPAYTVGGTVSGLNGSGLVLQNNAGDGLAIVDNGSFEFATPVLDQQNYEVTVATQPTQPSQTCLVVNGSGTVDGADVTNIEVSCEDRITTLTGTIRGLGYCQVNPAPLEAAMIEVTGATEVYSMTTGPDGEYLFQIPVDESPVSIEVAESSHLGASRPGVALDEGDLVEEDFDLILAAACAITDLDSINFRVLIENQADSSLVLSNSQGGSDLNWSMNTESGCYDPAAVSWLTVSDTSGLIDWGSGQTISLSTDATGLTTGQYQSTLCLSTSDLENDLIEVEIQLEVLGPDIFQDRFEQAP